jgi:hypothetical protein
MPSAIPKINMGVSATPAAGATQSCCGAEPMVRIHLPPAASPLRTDFPAGSKGRTQNPRGAHEPLTQIKQFLSAAHHLLSK